MAEDIKQILNEYKEETNRHFDVVAEKLEDKIQVIAEQVSGNTETLEIIKLDIETIKNDLKQKVSREEFVILEKRVGMLEAKSKR
ncbi:MAG: hypothetical protein A2654_00250 [Candidatus Nealsonbacteria bacterium RIFCSPHIGHO2_01_FULL_43_31]|uniref:Uncharacterized protein n=2 Tax=Candidatus Nealsoniibacteriota TaxID=1817911 RepID=A0A1G2E7A5_9BACT|nr:MAG: hypothetical protein A2654_00250 [Candidatus Nealsonbacteria bacterium RIFCSPHIGHO2_01_FULL_43_31]OGZ21609.1 MAG: hypothetical protein A3D46_01075 [Candidatus Nealsonbacteria bacterium RIFCSPHIGHO2_02_FULL_43_13]OGZ25408.1 MAG: hypothetical protein A2922_00495 [Candidatus Nealsonbacteria bacterium RIFCSPLOWO2_01_FULL_43_36]